MQGERPNTLLAERVWLLRTRSALKDACFPFRYGTDFTGQPLSLPADLAAAWQMNEQELHGNLLRLYETFKKLFNKLPKCSECEADATAWIQNGPFFCDIHAQEHPTAVRVPWYEELRLLGPDFGGG